jgi:hypothetical protein
MPSKQEVLQEHFNVSTWEEAFPIFQKHLDDTRKDYAFESSTKMQFPYEAPNHPVLPSLDEIRQVLAECNKIRRVYSGGAFKVGEFMVKACRHNSLLQVNNPPNTTLQPLTRSQEVEDILFLQANSQVRTPTIYAAFTHVEDFPIHYMIMDHIEGETLGDIWPSLDDKARSIITSRLCEQFQLLRSIPSEGFYGRVHRQKWWPMLNFLGSMKPEYHGPFNTYEEFVAALTSTIYMSAAIGTKGNDFHPILASDLSPVESTLVTCNGRQPTFTHLDPGMQNIMVRPIAGPQGTEDWEVTLIDWAYSGWCPAWVQAVSIQEKMHVFSGLKDEGRDQMVKAILDSFGEDYTGLVEMFIYFNQYSIYCIM